MKVEAIDNGTRAVLLTEIHHEVERAKVHGEKFASLHEAVAVIAEELDEVWDICKLKKCKRDWSDLRKELIQVAAMAVKSIESLENFVGGDV